MGKPLPLETRRAIVRMVHGTDCSQAEVAKIFSINERSVRRYLALHRETGDVDSFAKFGGHKPTILAAHEAKVCQLVDRQPDITLDALKTELAKQAIQIGQTALYNFLKTLGYSNKKNGVWSRTKETGHNRTSRGI